jgi:hypothetical protein
MSRFGQQQVQVHVWWHVNVFAYFSMQCIADPKGEKIVVTWLLENCAGCERACLRTMWNTHFDRCVMVWKCSSGQVRLSFRAILKSLNFLSSWLEGVHSSWVPQPHSVSVTHSVRAFVRRAWWQGVPNIISHFPHACNVILHCSNLTTISLLTNWAPTNYVLFSAQSKQMLCQISVDKSVVLGCKALESNFKVPPLCVPNP